MMLVGMPPAVVDAQIETEIDRLREHMSPLDVARLVWPECVRVPISRVSRSVLDHHLSAFTMDDLRQGVFIKKRGDDPEPFFVMNWETSQRRKEETEVPTK